MYANIMFQDIHDRLDREKNLFRRYSFAKFVNAD